MKQEYECRNCLKIVEADEECPECGSEELVKISRELDSEEDSLQL